MCDMSHECAWANFFVSKEVLCDFIMDARFPGDTLFIVMEEDYRFWPAGEDPQGCDNYHERLQQLLQEEDAMRRSGACRPDEEDFSVEAGGEGEHAKGRGRGIRLAGKYHHTPVPASTNPSDPNHGLQQEVADLIRMATFCSRQKQSEIIWFGWDGSQKNAFMADEGIARLNGDAAWSEHDKGWHEGQQDLQRPHRPHSLAISSQARERIQCQGFLHLASSWILLHARQRMRSISVRCRQRRTTSRLECGQ